MNLDTVLLLFFVFISRQCYTIIVAKDLCMVNVHMYVCTYINMYVSIKNVYFANFKNIIFVVIKYLFLPQFVSTGTKLIAAFVIYFYILITNN